MVPWWRHRLRHGHWGRIFHRKASRRTILLTYSCQSTRINDLQFNSNNCCNFFCSRYYWKSISWIFRIIDYQILCVIIIFSCKEYQADQRQNSWWGVAKFCYWIIFERETQLKILLTRIAKLKNIERDIVAPISSTFPTFDSFFH